MPSHDSFHLKSNQTTIYDMEELAVWLCRSSNEAQNVSKSCYFRPRKAAKTAISDVILSFQATILTAQASNLPAQASGSTAQGNKIAAQASILLHELPGGGRLVHGS